MDFMGKPPHGRKDLATVGEALFGDRWQSDVARLLDVDSRRVRAWMAGERPIPVGVWAELAAALRARRTSIDRVLMSITGQPRPTPASTEPPPRSS